MPKGIEGSSFASGKNQNGSAEVIEIYEPTFGPSDSNPAEKPDGEIPVLESQNIDNEPDFKINIPEVQKGELSTGEENILSREIMLKKAEACRLFRRVAHALLAHIGQIDPFIEDVKLQKIQKGFEKRFDSTMEELRSAVEVSATGPLSLVLGKLFRDYWNEQGMVSRLMAKLNKQRMGELEHAFILKTLSQKIEEATGLLEQAETAEQARFQNNNLKQYLRVIVEWDNEYQRLYKSIDSKKVELGEIYVAIEQATHGLDRVFIADKYETGDTNRNGELLTERELDFNQDEKKKRICADLLEGISREIEGKEHEALRESIVPILIEIDGTSDVETLAMLVNRYKKVIAEKNLNIFSPGGAERITRRIEEIEEIIRERKQEVF